MKLVLDRRSCTCWQAPCDSHFGNYFLGDEVKPVDCLIQMEDDGKAEITFIILDRDGIDKTLVVDENNRTEAIDSWTAAWEAQQKR